jgi:hypothetical protein
MATENETEDGKVYAEYMREANQLAQEYAIAPVHTDDREKLDVLAVQIAAIAGNAGADLGEFDITTVMDALEAAYRLGEAGTLREFGDTQEEYLQFCSDALGEDINKGDDPPDLSAFWGYINGA